MDGRIVVLLDDPREEGDPTVLPTCDEVPVGTEVFIVGSIRDAKPRQRLSFEFVTRLQDGTTNALSYDARAMMDGRFFIVDVVVYHTPGARRIELVVNGQALAKVDVSVLPRA